MVERDLFDKTRGQRMLLTKWIRNYNATEEPDEQEFAARKLAGVLAWAHSVGMSPSQIAEDRDLPHRALELFQNGTIERPAKSDDEAEAERDVASSVDTSNVRRAGNGHRR